jgi:hypothetical protein
VGGLRDRLHRDYRERSLSLPPPIRMPRGSLAEFGPMGPAPPPPTRPATPEERASPMRGSPRSRSSEVASALLSITTTRSSPQANESSQGDGFLDPFEGLLLGGLRFAFGNEPFGAVVSPPGARSPPSTSARDQSVAAISSFAQAGNVSLIRSPSDSLTHDRECRSCRDYGP